MNCLTSERQGEAFEGQNWPGCCQRSVKSHERLRPQYGKKSAAERDVPHGLVHGEELPAERSGNIGVEVHKLDQFFRVEEGEGKAVLDGIEHRIKSGFAVLVPAGTRHNIINGPSGPMKLYTLYAPPNHRDGVVHATKADAEADKEHFDGKTTE